MYCNLDSRLFPGRSCPFKEKHSTSVCHCKVWLLSLVPCYHDKDSMTTFSDMFVCLVWAGGYMWSLWQYPYLNILRLPTPSFIRLSGAGGTVGVWDWLHIYTVEYLEVKWLQLVPVPKTAEARCRDGAGKTGHTMTTQVTPHSSCGIPDTLWFVSFWVQKGIDLLWTNDLQYR